MLDLLKIRGEIDEIDEEIVRLFERRMDKSRQVAEYKIATGKPVLDKKRELEKIAVLKSLADTDFSRHGIEELFTQIMAMSRKLQYRLLVKNGKPETLNFNKVERLKTKNSKVVYAGVPGAYTHEAMMKFFGEDVDHYNVITFRQVMEEVQQGKADYGVLPIENSTAGGVTDVYDLLMDFDNYIVAETAVKVNHALLSIPGAKLSDIKSVYSHPQGFMQSSEFLEEHPEWSKISTTNTALSAKKVIQMNNKSNAAIASITAAKIYGLQVLQEHLNVSNINTTRFIVISKTNIFVEGAVKVCVSFEVPHATGSLYEMLSHFIYNNISMSKIESRPVPGQNWKYRFLVVIDGNVENTEIINALQGIAAEAESVKILGCY